MVHLMQNLLLSDIRLLYRYLFVIQQKWCPIAFKGFTFWGTAKVTSDCFYHLRENKQSNNNKLYKERLVIGE